MMVFGVVSHPQKEKKKGRQGKKKGNQKGEVRLYAYMNKNVAR